MTNGFKFLAEGMRVDDRKKEVVKLLLVGVMDPGHLLNIH